MSRMDAACALPRLSRVGHGASTEDHSIPTGVCAARRARFTGSMALCTRSDPTTPAPLASRSGDPERSTCQRIDHGVAVGRAVWPSLDCVSRGGGEIVWVHGSIASWALCTLGAQARFHRSVGSTKHASRHGGFRAATLAWDHHAERTVDIAAAPHVRVPSSAHDQRFVVALAVRQRTSAGCGGDGSKRCGR